MKADTASDHKIATVVSSTSNTTYVVVGTQKEEIGKSYYVFIRMYFPFGGFVPYRTKRIRGGEMRLSASMTFVRSICAVIYPLCLLEFHTML